jgi:transcriptional regulator with XRE-family HTH domain
MGDVLPFKPAPDPADEPLWRELVGEHLRDQRHERGERLVDVAERAGVSTQYLSEVERGLKDPSSEILSAVAGALGLSVGEIAFGVARRLATGLRADLSAPPRGPLCLAA